MLAFYGPNTGARVNKQSSHNPSMSPPPNTGRLARQIEGRPDEEEQVCRARDELSAVFRGSASARTCRSPRCSCPEATGSTGFGAAEKQRWRQPGATMYIIHLIPFEITKEVGNKIN